MHQALYPLQDDCDLRFVDDCYVHEEGVLAEPVPFWYPTVGFFLAPLVAVSGGYDTGFRRWIYNFPDLTEDEVDSRYNGGFLAPEAPRVVQPPGPLFAHRLSGSMLAVAPAFQSIRAFWLALQAVDDGRFRLKINDMSPFICTFLIELMEIGLDVVPTPLRIEYIAGSCSQLATHVFADDRIWHFLIMAPGGFDGEYHCAGRHHDVNSPLRVFTGSTAVADMMMWIEAEACAGLPLRAADAALQRLVQRIQHGGIPIERLLTYQNALMLEPTPAANLPPVLGAMENGSSIPFLHPQRGRSQTR